MTFQEFKKNVEQWAQGRGIYEHSTVEAQLMKGLSELGELADAIVKDDRDGLKDAIGDVAVCMVNAAAMGNTPLDGFDDLIADLNADPDLVEQVGDCETAAAMTGWLAQLIGSDILGEADDNDMLNTFLALHALAASVGMEFTDCCEHAWQEIKDRRGRMVPGGAFVKEAS